MSTIIRALVILAAAVLSPGAWAAAYTVVDPGHSRIGFVFNEMGVPVSGTFKRFGAQLSFDPARPSAASIFIDLDPASVDAGTQDVNSELLGRDWFDVRAYPQARFVSTSVRALDGNRYEALGKLTIKGRTRQMTVPFTCVPNGKMARFDGAFAIKRADFAVGEGEWADYATVANEVQIKFEIQAAVPAGK